LQPFRETSETIEVGKEERVPIAASAPLEARGKQGEPEWELLVYTPAVFVRAANKGVTAYVTWKKIRKMGDRRAVGTFEC
jgi:hypothetical protein